MARHPDTVEEANAHPEVFAHKTVGQVADRQLAGLLDALELNVPDALVQNPAHDRGELRDGSRVEIRALGPDDKAGLAAGFERLSEDSRYRRFLSPTPHLTARQLAYLTEVDHHDHGALVAIEPTRRDGVGVARYVRSQANLDEAEFAVAVADDWQRLGLGTALLRQLATRAREAGITWFTGLVLARNESILHVLAGLGDVERRSAGAAAIEVRLQVPDDPHHDEHETRLARWMHVAATGELESRLR